MPRIATLIGAVLAASAALAGALVWIESERAMQRPLALTRPALFRIEAGTNLHAVARALEAEGWLAHRGLLILRARLAGQAGSIQAGTYEIRPGDTLAAVLARFVAGDTKIFSVTFVEGCRFSDMRRILASAPWLVRELPRLGDAEVARILGLESVSPEGLFFPSTYHYQADTSDLLILRRARARMQEVLARLWHNRGPDLPYATPYEALIMASIIEKETGRAEERGQIAGVFVRRLLRGMKLQTDPTVIYGLDGEFDGNLRRLDLERDTAYNTYTRRGLPPTPIAMPGEAAITAALDPAPGTALYFVAKGDGAHQFSDSLGEHQSAVRRYQIDARR